jgi:hypothetical protein
MGCSNRPMQPSGLLLPPYSPQLNPIEVCFGMLKRWIQSHANLVFPLYPEKVLQVAMIQCTSNNQDTCKNLYRHGGYSEVKLRDLVFDNLMHRNIEVDYP